MRTTPLFCCECQQDVHARLSDGTEVYPHRPDLGHLPFWICPGCKNFVGCHHKSQRPTKPLGPIPTPLIRKARREIHALLDPLWRSGVMSREEAYHWLTDQFGYEYHTAELTDVREARKVYQLILDLKKHLKQKGRLK